MPNTGLRDELSINMELPMNACLACKQHKRRCDKVHPMCGTCQRVGRQCRYDKEPVQVSSGSTQQAKNATKTQAIQASTLLVISHHQIDPFRYASLRQPTIDVIVSKEASNILGDIQAVKLTASKYFATNFLRMPIISKARFFQQLPFLYAAPRADFTLLCLCLHLIIQRPDAVELGASMHSSIYIMIKSFISAIESLTELTLATIQAMILIVLYEIGHGMYPVASISVAACARSARTIKLNSKKTRVSSRENVSSWEAGEERRRVWWAITNLDRFINLCAGDNIFATEDPQADDSLPVDIEVWEDDMAVTSMHMDVADGSLRYLDEHNFTLLTPSNIKVGPFARECQISHLVGRVVRHVFDPSSDLNFQKEEASQLERTLNAFMPLLMEQEEKYGLFCAALGLCSSALFTLYDTALLSGKYSDAEMLAVHNSLESTSTRIAAFSKHLFADIELVNIDKMSPFVPYSLYQAAVVQYRLFKKTGASNNQDAFESLKSILVHFRRRWHVAVYLEALESLMTDWPLTIYFMQGTSMSIRGPTGDPSHPYAH